MPKFSLARFTKAVYCLLTVLIGSNINAQSPWVKGKKHAYTHISAGIIPFYKHVFKGNRSNIEALNVRINELSLQSYTEYGLSQKIDIIANVPLKFISSEVLQKPALIEAGNLVGMGNLQLGAKYGTKVFSIPISFQTMLGLPTGTSSDLSGLRTAYPVHFVISNVSVGKAFNQSYCFIYGGLAWFQGMYNEDFRLGIEYGYHFKERLWLMLTLMLRESLNNNMVKENAAFSQSYLYVNNQYFTSLALKMHYAVKPGWGINFAINIISIRANNLPFQRPASLGIYKKW